MLNSSFDDEIKRRRLSKSKKFDPEKIKSHRMSKRASGDLRVGSSGGTTPITLTKTAYDSITQQD